MRTPILSFLGGLAFAFAGATAPADAQQTPKRGGTFEFAISAETPHYDCHGSDTYATLHFAGPFYSTLLRFNLPKFPEVEGDLAELWTVAPDLMTYTFKLHPGVKFHDGTTLTSADVKATYDRLRNPPQGVVSTRQGDLPRHRHDRDARRQHRDLQDEVGERGDARAFRLALELHLCGQGPRRRSERAQDQDQRHRPVHLRRARQGQPRLRQEERQLFQEGPALSRRLPRRVHAAAGGHDQRGAGRPAAGRVPRHLAGRA